MHGQIISIEGMPMGALGGDVWVDKQEVRDLLYWAGFLADPGAGSDETLAAYRRWWTASSGRGPFPEEFRVDNGNMQMDSEIYSQLQADAARSAEPSPVKEKINWAAIVGVTAGVGLIFLFTTTMKHRDRARAVSSVVGYLEAPKRRRRRKGKR